jgi:hypothetical protein
MSQVFPAATDGPYSVTGVYVEPRHFNSILRNIFRVSKPTSHVLDNRSSISVRCPCQCSRSLSPYEMCNSCCFARRMEFITSLCLASGLRKQCSTQPKSVFLSQGCWKDVSHTLRRSGTPQEKKKCCRKFG